MMSFPRAASRARVVFMRSRTSGAGFDFSAPAVMGLDFGQEIGAGDETGLEGGGWRGGGRFSMSGAVTSTRVNLDAVFMMRREASAGEACFPLKWEMEFMDNIID